MVDFSGNHGGKSERNHHGSSLDSGKKLRRERWGERVELRSGISGFHLLFNIEEDVHMTSPNRGKGTMISGSCPA